MRTKNLPIILLIIGFVLVSFSCSLLSRKYEKKEKVTYKLNVNGKTKLELNNISGHINISPSDSITGLVIEAEKIGYVKKKDMDKPLDYIKINIDSSSGAIKISTEIEKNRSWIHFDLHHDEVNYDIKVPAGLMLSIEGTNGEIHLDGFPNESKVRLTNGNIKLTGLTGRNDVEMTNGSISGSIDSLKELKLEVTNGKVTLDIGKKFAGEINAEIVNGKISTDKLELSDVSSDKKSLRGYITNRSGELRINVVNGKISLNGQADAKTTEK